LQQQKQFSATNYENNENSLEKGETSHVKRLICMVSMMFSLENKGNTHAV